MVVNSKSQYPGTLHGINSCHSSRTVGEWQGVKVEVTPRRNVKIENKLDFRHPYLIRQVALRVKTNMAASCACDLSLFAATTNCDLRIKFKVTSLKLQ